MKSRDNTLANQILNHLGESHGTFDGSHTLVLIMMKCYVVICLSVLYPPAHLDVSEDHSGGQLFITNHSAPTTRSGLAPEKSIS
jgi:hypothetical protein